MAPKPCWGPWERRPRIITGIATSWWQRGSAVHGCQAREGEGWLNPVLREDVFLLPYKKGINDVDKPPFSVLEPKGPEQSKAKQLTEGLKSVTLPVGTCLKRAILWKPIGEVVSSQIQGTVILRGGRDLLPYS